MKSDGPMKLLKVMNLSNHGKWWTYQIMESDESIKSWKRTENL